jgi:hypothetical protein
MIWCKLLAVTPRVLQTWGRSGGKVIKVGDNGRRTSRTVGVGVRARAERRLRERDREVPRWLESECERELRGDCVRERVTERRHGGEGICDLGFGGGSGEPRSRLIHGAGESPSLILVINNTKLLMLLYQLE